MAKGNFALCLKETLSHEGGWADHPRDPGGATMKGVTIGRFREHYPKATKTDLRNISDADLQRIYRQDYWNPVRGDDLPAGIDLTTFDYGVNSGPRQSAKDLQRVLGVPVDGKIGPVTIKAALLVEEPAKPIKAHCARRLGMYRSLAIWNTFGKGWSHRIASIEAKALSWVLSKAQLEREAKAARDKAISQGGGAVVTTGGGGGVAVDQTANLPVGWIIAAVAIVVFVLAVRTIINAQRAKALANAAKEA